MEIYVMCQQDKYTGEVFFKGYTFSEDTAMQIVAKAEELKQMDFFEDYEEVYYVPVSCLDGERD